MNLTSLEDPHPFLKYIIIENGKSCLACTFFVFNCSKLEEEEEKNNVKERKDKAKPEKVKREAAQVTVLDFRTRKYSIPLD